MDRHSEEDLMTRASRPRPKLADSVHQQLNMYALAASAAGVSLLALVPDAEAKIIYTKADQVIGRNGVYNLDLNHDGTVDFLIEQSVNTFSSGAGNASLLVDEALGNAVEGYIGNKYSRHYAAALKLGAWIGPRQHFIKRGSGNGEDLVGFHEDQDQRIPYTYGQWINVKNRYLGLKFLINGKVHYGWARLNVHNKLAQMSARLTGYAYETVPGKSILAGQTEESANKAAASESANSDADASPAVAETIVGTPRSASLGKLALGAQAAAFRRQP
jgi:hypothetical protein